MNAKPTSPTLEQELLNEGKKKNLISINEDTNYITYIHQKKSRNLNNPEEKIQALTFLKLVIEYKYPVEYIEQFASVQMGSYKKEADIIVYSDTSHKSPLIVVECKKEKISELEFETAIDQAFSYAVSEGAKFVWVTSGLKDEYYEVPIEKPKERIIQTDIPRFKEKFISDYKFVKGGIKDGKKFHDIARTTESELTNKFGQAHNALWGGGELNASEAFDELDKLIFCKIWDEKNCKRGEPYKFQIISEYIQDEDGNKNPSIELTNQKLQERMNALYEEGRKKDPEVFKEPVKLKAEKIRTVVTYLQNINLNKTDLDSKGRAFETFMGSFFRGDFGQYFTPRPIVKFIVNSLPLKRDSYVLDTSCGSGGFLLHSLDKIRMQANEEYPDYQTDASESREHYKYWHDFAEKYLYGIEINEQISRTAKMNMIIHDDGHTNVISCDGLLQIAPTKAPLDENNKDREERETANKNTIQIKGKNTHFKQNHFDFIITNPPFGSAIKQTEKAYLSNYGFGVKEVDWRETTNTTAKNRDSQSTEILFIEQADNFLKEGGYLAIVIPDGVLTNSSLQFVRDSIEEMYRIIAVVSMPQSAFSSTGAGVKSSVLFLKKYNKKQSDNIKNLKLKLQEYLIKKHSYIEEVNKINNEKKEEVKKANLKYKKGSEELKNERQKITKKYKDKIDSLKDNMMDKYKESKEEALKEYDYDIFMAIAEDIGYDATGKETGNNELDFIGEKLSEFIESIK